MATEHEFQHIARFTPLADVLARIDALVKPVAARELDLADAFGRTLAQDVVVPSLPEAPLAVRDGWAVASSLTTDASSYAPAPMAAPPRRIDVGEALPSEADAVAPLDAVVFRGDRAEVIAPVAPGDGVLTKGGDADGRVPLLPKGAYLGRTQLAALAALDVRKVFVAEPRVHVLSVGTIGDRVIDASARLLAAAVDSHGGIVLTGAAQKSEDRNLTWALKNSGADALIAIGGTGSGRNDASVRTLAQVGSVEAHGVALLPGETMAFGMVGRKPVLLVPGRIDAALAVWLTVGRHLMARLSGGTRAPLTSNVVLSRKVASPLGMTEIVPMRCRDGRAEPIASGYWPLSTMAQADGWIMVPADSEGCPAGAEVVLRPWP
jgi:molybdopterin biosynthesis enzyme